MAKKMELLAPAGGFDQLRAAVRFGADAVYLAADRFGMRARAANFALEEIPEAVKIAHAAGVKVHVTCNVLMDADDIAALPGYLRAIDAAGVDALIIGDMGAFALAREHAPHVELHVSTQASVANAAAARVWHSLGAKRVVCAREMSLDDIRRMREDTPDDLEIEAFAHGAMCMAVSGRCLISSYLTGRSGNKGHCTQPCRWSYTLEEEKRPGEHFPVEEDDRGTFIMNAKDLNMFAHLDELAAAGVDSIKIEGRNKKAFYVASVVGAYRRALDGAPVAEVERELLDVSHRPYSTGFYFGEGEQAPDYDGYEQETLHVADVTDAPDRMLQDVEGPAAGAGAASDSSASDGGRSGVMFARCRNRFAEGEVLEVLAPHERPWTVTVRNLVWLPDPTEDDPNPAPVPVPVANRSCNLYRFEVERVAEAGAFLRVRRHRRSARHEESAATA